MEAQFRQDDPPKLVLGCRSPTTGRDSSTYSAPVMQADKTYHIFGDFSRVARGCGTVGGEDGLPRRFAGCAALAATPAAGFVFALVADAGLAAVSVGEVVTGRTTGFTADAGSGEAVSPART